MCFTDSDHGNSITAGELLGNLCGDLYVPSGAGAECLGAPEQVYRGRGLDLFLKVYS